MLNITWTRLRSKSRKITCFTGAPSLIYLRGLKTDAHLRRWRSCSRVCWRTLVSLWWQTMISLTSRIWFSVWRWCGLRWATWLSSKEMSHQMRMLLYLGRQKWRLSSPILNLVRSNQGIRNSVCWKRDSFLENYRYSSRGKELQLSRFWGVRIYV